MDTNSCKIKFKRHLILRATLFAILNYSHEKRRVKLFCKSSQCTHMALNLRKYMQINIILHPVFPYFIVCDQRSRAINDRVRSTIACDQRSRAINDRVRSTIACDQRSRAINDRVRSTIACDQRSRAMPTSRPKELALLS